MLKYFIEKARTAGYFADVCKTASAKENVSDLTIICMATKVDSSPTGSVSRSFNQG